MNIHIYHNPRLPYWKPTFLNVWIFPVFAEFSVFIRIIDMFNAEWKIKKLMWKAFIAKSSKMSLPADTLVHSFVTLIC